MNYADIYKLREVAASLRKLHAAHCDTIVKMKLLLDDKEKTVWEPLATALASSESAKLSTLQALEKTVAALRVAGDGVRGRRCW